MESGAFEFRFHLGAAFCVAWDDDGQCVWDGGADGGCDPGVLAGMGAGGENHGALVSEGSEHLSEFWPLCGWLAVAGVKFEASCVMDA